jgi:hypothetical protein
MTKSGSGQRRSCLDGAAAILYTEMNVEKSGGSIRQQQAVEPNEPPVACFGCGALLQYQP